MTKNDLIQIVMLNDKTISKEQAKNAVESVFNGMKVSLYNGHDVTYRRFGTFKVVTRKAKKGRNISKGITIDIPEKKVAVLKPSKELAAHINANA